MIQSINYKGISHRPDNITAPDGDLSICLNLVNDDGNIRPLEKPTHIADLPNEYVALYIHESPQAIYKNLIVYNTTDKSLQFALWEDVTNQESTGNISWATIMTELPTQPVITAIGNTLVINTKGAPIKYAIWKNDTILSHAGSYKALAQHPPFVPMQFCLAGIKKGTMFNTSGFSFPLNSQNSSGNTDDDTLGSFDKIPEEVSRRYITEEIFSFVNDFIAESTTNSEKGAFLFPFLVRYAIRFYDGTLVMHSHPVLLIPSSHIIAEINNMSWHSTGATMTVNSATGAIHATCAYLANRINSIPESLNDWEDIINSIDIYISAPLYTHNQSGYIKGWCNSIGTPLITPQKQLSVTTGFISNSIESESFYLPKYQFLLPNKEKEIIKQEVESCSLFYKIHSIPFNEIKESNTNNGNQGFSFIDIKGSTLSALTSQEVMTDDYNSHSNIFAETTFVYNSRLNLANITEEIDADIPIDSQLPFQMNPQKKCSHLGISLTLNNQLHKILNSHSGDYNSLPRYLYFPHPNATNIRWLDYGSEADVFDFPLKQHPGLNGAVYFRGFDEDDMPDEVYSFYDYFEKAIAHYPNKIYTSEVDNPFVFKPENINTLNCGVIKSVASATQALSQGQFGQFPLYAFTDDGIWALEISATGSFNSIQPVSRDVILDDSKLLNIDNAIIFLTAKGMMSLQGSNTSLLSQNLNDSGDSTIPDLRAINITETFNKFPAKGTLAYDYSHQRIYLFSSDIAWVYSIKTGLWSQAEILGPETYTLNSYPDTILVTQNNDDVAGLKQSLYSLNNECEHFDNGVLLTRPIKFASTSLRTVRDVITYGLLSNNEVTSILFGSPDMKNFVPITAIAGNEIHRISGTPYKAHRLLLKISNATHDTSISHTSFNVNERYTNKLR